MKGWFHLPLLDMELLLQEVIRYEKKIDNFRFSPFTKPQWWVGYESHMEKEIIKVRKYLQMEYISQRVGIHIDILCCT